MKGLDCVGANQIIASATPVITSTNKGPRLLDTRSSQRPQALSA